MQSASTWSSIQVTMTPQDTAAFVCNGITIQGDPVELSGQITPADNVIGAGKTCHISLDLITLVDMLEWLTVSLITLTVPWAKFC